MKITVWTAVMAGSHHAPVVTTHSTRDEARKMLEHALEHEGITFVGDDDTPLPTASLAELKEAWEVHFDGHCLIERHEVDVPLVELDAVIADLRDMIGPQKLEKAIA